MAYGAELDINLAAEFYHRLYDRVHDVRSCVLRLTNTIGPRMRVRDARQTFVGIWIRRILDGQVDDFGLARAVGQVDFYDPTGFMDLKEIAVSRLMLDNIPHIKAYWIMMTPRVAQIALRFD